MNRAVLEQAQISELAPLKAAGSVAPAETRAQTAPIRLVKVMTTFAAGGTEGQVANIARRIDPPLALAVVAIAPGLQDARHPDALDRPGQVAVAVDRRIRRGSAPELLRKPLFAQAILRHLERAG